jgi:hypothetical protein
LASWHHQISEERLCPFGNYSFLLVHSLHTVSHHPGAPSFIGRILIWTKGINYTCQKYKLALGEWDWKIVVIFQMLVPIIIIVLLPFLPESPRWYIQHGWRVEEARASLRRVRETEQEVEDEVLMIREALEFEHEAISSSYSALWKDRSVRKRLILAFIVNMGQQLTGKHTLY